MDDEGEIHVNDANGDERSSPVSMDVQGDIAYVAHSGGSMPGIWTLDLNGNVIDTLPASLAVAPTGDMFTVDPFSRTARWYAPDGAQKSEWGLDVGFPGAFTFVNIAVGDTGTVDVSDGDTRQILVYEPIPSGRDLCPPGLHPHHIRVNAGGHRSLPTPPADSCLPTP